MSDIWNCWASKKEGSEGTGAAEGVTWGEAEALWLMAEGNRDDRGFTGWDPSSTGDTTGADEDALGGVAKAAARGGGAGAWFIRSSRFC